MKRLTILLYILVAACGCAFCQTAQFISADQFSSSLISDLCQDRQGSVWIATDYGLNRYDGYEFQTFLHDDNDPASMGVNVVVSLLCDNEGRLWVGTNRGVDRFDADRETFVHYPFPEGETPRVSCIVQRRDGTLLIGTAGYGAFFLDGDGKLKRFSMGKSDNYYSHIFEDSRGRLWRTGFDDMISMLNGDKTTDYRSVVGAPQGFVESADELLIACQHGFMSFRNGKMSVADIDMSSVAGRDISFSSVRANANGDIYIGTRGHGLYCIPSRRPLRLERMDINVPGIDQQTAKVSAVMFDRKGNLWTGCERKGLLLLPQRPMQFANWSFAAQNVRLGSTISSVCEGDNNMTWCTVQGVGVYGFDRQGRIKAHPSAPPAVEFIFRDRLQRYWIGTDDGLFAYDPLTGRSQLKVNFDCDKFNDMTSDETGNIYISTFSRGFCVYNPQSGSLRNYSMFDENKKLGRL
jgi:ligand-binding sensor domain-containing protein